MILANKICSALIFSKNNNKSKQMSIGRKKFNMDPKKGIEYLQGNGLLQATPEDVAGYLYKGEGLNKTAIGDYLGEKNPFNEKVLRAFVELHDFTDLILVQALRYFEFFNFLKIRSVSMRYSALT